MRSVAAVVGLFLTRSQTGAPAKGLQTVLMDLLSSFDWQICQLNVSVRRRCEEVSSFIIRERVYARAAL